MKRLFGVFLCLFAAVSVFGLSGEVIALKGKAEVQKDGGTWSVPSKGEILSKGTLISTGFKSELTLKVDGTIIVVQPLTRLRLDEIVKKGDTVSSEVYLDVGSIKADVKPANTKKVEFTVRTPVATASVRGTSGEISSEGVLSGSSGVWSFVNNDGTAAYVAAGETVNIDSLGNITPAQIFFAENTKAETPATLAEKEKFSSGVGAAKDTSEASSEREINIQIDLNWED